MHLFYIYVSQVCWNNTNKSSLQMQQGTRPPPSRHAPAHYQYKNKTMWPELA